MIKSTENILEGVIVPVITPLNKNENLDIPAFQKLLNFLIDSGVNGIFVGGSAGMGPMLDERTWRELMSHAVSIINGRCALMGGVIETSSKRAVQKIKILEELGYDTMVVTPSFYVTLQKEDEFIRHFAICREASAMRMLVYNIPSCTGSEIPHTCLEKMAERKWLTGLKDSSGSKLYFQKAFEISRKYEFNIFQGNESDISWSLSNNVNGLVPVCANFTPELFVDVWHNRDSDTKLIQLQSKIEDNKVKYVIGDGTKSWISGVVCETSRRLGIDCTVAHPLANCNKLL